MIASELDVTIEPRNRWTFVLDDNTRILFVDDDVILAEFAKVHLATPTTTVESVENGRDAWDRLSSESFDVVLLDIEMPELDGFGLLERLRADSRFVHLPVVMLTGREDIVSIDRAFQLGATSFITKPINWRQLSYSLRYVLRATRMEGDLIRERKRSEELLQLTNSLLSLIRLEARTPLGSIIGFCDCITQQIDGPVGESYLRYAEQIDAAARQMQSIFMDLVQYAQLTSGAATLSEDEYSSGKLLDAAAASLAQDSGGASPALEVVKPEENFFVQCDLMWLSRAMRHLLEVAGAGGARVTLGMAASAGGGAITIASEAPPAAQGAEGTTLEAVRRSMGVGVAFARCVIDMHGGELQIDKRDDGSTTMTIRLPPARIFRSEPRLRTVEAT